MMNVDDPHAAAQAAAAAAAASMSNAGSAATYDSIETFQTREPCRMEVSDQERTWAKAIKAAVASDPELDEWTDFEYVQLALVDGENVESALERIQVLQYIKQEYDIRDTYQEGCHVWHRMVQLWPTAILSFAYYHERESYMIVGDMAGIQEKRLETQEDRRIMHAFFYYFGHIFCPDFAAIRHGSIFVLEGEGYVHCMGVCVLCLFVCMCVWSCMDACVCRIWFVGRGLIGDVYA